MVLWPKLAGLTALGTFVFFWQDTIGVQLGGALKNPLAVGAGTATF